MSYIEIGSCAFRGELRGATGFFKGSLTALAIDAVDTVNIASGQITYNTLVSYSNQAASVGSNLLVANINVPDSLAFIEIQAFGAGAVQVFVDGTLRAPTSMGTPGNRLVPYTELILLAGGPHQIILRSGINGVSSFGYIHVQYIRRTGQ